MWIIHGATCERPRTWVARLPSTLARVVTAQAMVWCLISSASCLACAHPRDRAAVERLRWTEVAHRFSERFAEGLELGGKNRQGRGEHRPLEPLRTRWRGERASQAVVTAIERDGAQVNRPREGLCIILVVRDMRGELIEELGEEHLLDVGARLEEDREDGDAHRLAGCHVDDVHLERVLHAPDRGLRGGVEVELRRLEGGASDTHAPALPVDLDRVPIVEDRAWADAIGEARVSIHRRTGNTRRWQDVDGALLLARGCQFVLWR
mmetsp:Transcript_11673/g.34385  ORF Transcript_11673/g.34385 Transcript_11673/m.34385 type:complete len:265 (-) Transcript_11673:333-1127(-)